MVYFYYIYTKINHYDEVSTINSKSIVQFGDIDNINSYTRTVINSDNRTMEFFSTSGRYLSLDKGNNVYQIGDIDGGSGNLTKFVVNDVSESTFVYNDGEFKIFNSIGDSGWLSVQPAGGQVLLGDITNNHNKTLFRVDDVNKWIYGKTDVQFYLSNTIGNLFLNIDLTNNLYQIGDINVSLNGTNLAVDDNLKSIKGQSTGLVQFGDILGSASNTYIGISDTTQLIEINAKGHVSIGDVSGFFGGTNLYVNNNANTISLSTGTFSMNNQVGINATYSTGDGRIVTITNGIITNLA